MNLIAMEWGFRAHEKGMNLEMAIQEYQKMIVAESELQPMWRSEIFTDREREEMVTAKIEEIHDCTKDLAHDDLDGCDLLELVGIIDPDVEVTTELLGCLQEGHACMEDYESGEFEHHAVSANLMRRFNMVEGGKLTPFGLKYLGEYS